MIILQNETINQTTLFKPLTTVTQSLLDDNIDELIENQYGHIRRKFVKSVFDKKLIDYDEVVNIYDNWRNDDEYIILRGIGSHLQTNLLDEQKQPMVDGYIYRFIKASKRGNDVYRYLVKRKFKQIDEIEDIEFFKDNFRRKKTKLLFITLTFDIKASTPLESWYKIPKIFNLFKANLTKQFGKIKTFRVWESTEKYYAHIHCLIYFQECEFEVFPHYNKQGYKTYRIPIYQVKKIKTYYPYQIDIQACDTFQRALKEITKYVGKYLIKDTVENKPTKTNAMIWLTNKQGYSISKDFFKTIIRENLDIEEPKPSDLTRIMCNSNSSLVNWEYIGLISAKKLKTNGKIWFMEQRKPPPEVLDHIQTLLLEKLNKW